MELKQLFTFCVIFMVCCLYGAEAAVPTWEELKDIECPEGSELCIHSAGCCKFALEVCSKSKQSCVQAFPFLKESSPADQIHECCRSMKYSPQLVKYCFYTFGTTNLMQTCLQSNDQAETKTSTPCPPTDSRTRTSAADQAETKTSTPCPPTDSRTRTSAADYVTYIFLSLILCGVLWLILLKYDVVPECRFGGGRKDHAPVSTGDDMNVGVPDE